MVPFLLIATQYSLFSVFQRKIKIEKDTGKTKNQDDYLYNQATLYLLLKMMIYYIIILIISLT